MIMVQDKIVSTELFEERFACNLNACKGACCWEGDYGAPLELSELETLKDLYDLYKPYLTDEGIAKLEKEGLYEFVEETKEYATTLLDNGACAYLTFNPDGSAYCGIEKAYHDGAIDYRKPISCHLYPVRINANEELAFEALNYDVWDICSAACQKGKEKNIKVYEFAKDALVRKYGISFYEELDEIAKDLADGGAEI